MSAAPLQQRNAARTRSNKISKAFTLLLVSRGGISRGRSQASLRLTGQWFQDLLILCKLILGILMLRLGPLRGPGPVSEDCRTVCLV